MSPSPRRDFTCPCPQPLLAALIPLRGEAPGEGDATALLGASVPPPQPGVLVIRGDRRVHPWAKQVLPHGRVAEHPDPLRKVPHLPGSCRAVPAPAHPAGRAAC